MFYFVGLVGTVLAHKDKQAAFGCCRIGMALGFVIGFVCALVINVQAMLWIDVAFVTIAMTCYSILMITSHLHVQVIKFLTLFIR